MNLKLLATHWNNTPYAVKKALYFCTQHQSENNMCYLVGYITSAKDHGLLAYDDYTFWLAYTGQPHREVLALWENEKP